MLYYRSQHISVRLTLPLVAALALTRSTRAVNPIEVTPFGSVAIDTLRLPEDRVDVRLAGADNPCVCHRACFVKACRCYSLVRTGDGSLDCLISLTPVPIQDMLLDTNTRTMFKPNYIPSGERFYRILQPVNRVRGISQCADDEAQVAVIETQAKQNELVSIMGLANLHLVRVGLFMSNSEHPLTPRWTLLNGTSFAANILPVRTDRQCFTLNLADGGTPTLQNVNLCSDLLPTICQRDH